MKELETTSKINDIIKYLRKSNIISDKQNQQFLLNLQIIDKIQQAKSTSANKDIIKKIYNICLQNFNTTAENKNRDQIFSLTNQLELGNFNTRKLVTIYYDYWQALPEVSIPQSEIISDIQVESKTNTQLIGVNFPWKTKFEKYKIYNLKEKVKLDHEGGRPAIYLGFNEQTQKHKFICGTSLKNKDNENEVLKLNLSKETYFYYQNIRLIDDKDVNDVINDFWVRDVKSNKPIDFLDLFSEKREELEQNLEKFSDPSGMTEYFQKLESGSLSKVEQTIDNSVFKELLVTDSKEENLIDSKEIVTCSSKTNIEEKLSGLKVVSDQLSLNSLDWEELMEKTKELSIAINENKFLDNLVNEDEKDNGKMIVSIKIHY